MSTDRSMARCSFCGRYSSEVRRLIAGPGAANICDTCLQLCNDILQDSTPFSAKALELASRPPVVIAAPRIREQQEASTGPISREALRVVNIALEQKQQDMTLLLHSMHYFQSHFELHYLWMRPPLRTGFAFVPRIIFFLQDSTGMQWAGDRGGTLLARPELASGLNNAVYQGSARFQPLPGPEARTLKIRVSDPLGQFEESALSPWEFEVTL